MSSTEEGPAGGDALASTELKTTAKWLVGASASTAAIVVAGLQLTALEKVGQAEWWIGVLALAAAFLALAAAGRVLYQAAAVLAVTRPSIATLDSKDRGDHGNYPDGPRLEQPRDPLLRELVVLRRAELLGAGRDAIGSLVDDLTRAGQALRAGADVTIQGRTYRPAQAADVAALGELTADLERRIGSVSDAAERFETTNRFARLKRQLLPHGIVFLIGIFGFAWLTLLYPQRFAGTAKITTPVQVEVTVPSESAATRSGLEKGCVGTLTGAAVGGTLDEPVVVTRPTERCPAHELDDTHHLVVVPLPAK
ncbi:hypothetical protein ACWGEU_11205 [Streptomyces goshikiensis]